LPVSRAGEPGALEAEFLFAPPNLAQYFIRHTPQCFGLPASSQLQPARVRKPRDKTNVENGVQNVERWVLAPLRRQTFFSEAEANRAIQPLVEELNKRLMLHLSGS
jgi:transposase